MRSSCYQKNEYETAHLIICVLKIRQEWVGMRRYVAADISERTTILILQLHAPVYDDKGNMVTEKSCPFCRTINPTSKEEAVNRANKRVECGDAMAIYDLANSHADGTNGHQQDYSKALELYHRAAKLGYADSYFTIGCAYDTGDGAEIDKKKAIHYYELAAMQGSVKARYNLGVEEEQANGNMDRALKHYMIAVRGGYSNAVKEAQELFKRGFATKDDYLKALQSYQEYLNEIKSDQRDKAAAALDTYKYYE